MVIYSTKQQWPLCVGNKAHQQSDLQIYWSHLDRRRCHTLIRQFSRPAHPFVHVKPCPHTHVGACYKVACYKVLPSDFVRLCTMCLCRQACYKVACGFVWITMWDKRPTVPAISVRLLFCFPQITRQIHHLTFTREKGQNSK